MKPYTHTVIWAIALLFLGCSLNNPYGKIIDNRDGKTYKTIKIGEQTWMAENLSYYTSEGCWAYGNDELNVKKYGYLYDWQTSNDVCPTGWKLPSKEEYEVLFNYIDKDIKTLLDNKGFSAQLAGKRFGDNNYKYIGDEANFWTSTGSEYIPTFAFADVYLGFNLALETNGFSVRCLKIEE